MKRIIAISLISLVLSGCGGLGFNKRATLMPDVLGMYYETSPNGVDRDYKTLKVGVRTDWKFQ